ncbi:MAG: two-component regulator propeller domain-containing protein [Terracidiphilus sp.]
MSTFLILMTIVIMTSFCRTAECLNRSSSYPQYLSQIWTMSNGFPGGRINAITQTADGYLWIGTSKGLFRFDGFTFVPADSPGHVTDPVSQALTLVSAKDGALWMGDQDMNVRRYIHGRFDDATSIAGDVGGVVSAIGASNEGDVLVATQGPRLFLYSHGRSEALSGNSNLGIPSPQTVVQTRDGKIWLATFEAGLFYWDRGSVTALKEDVPDKVNCLYPAESGGLWIGTDEGVVFWDGRRISTRISSHALRGSRVLSLAEDRDKNVWIGTSNGLFRLNSAGIRLMEQAQPRRTEQSRRYSRIGKETFGLGTHRE